MQVSINQTHKSIPAGLKFELPGFCIFTGINGSGKSHLLEAIASPNISHAAINNRKVDKINHIPINGLNPTIDELCDNNQINSHIENVWNQTRNLIEQCRNNGMLGKDFSDIKKLILSENFRHHPNFGNAPMVLGMIEKIYLNSNKNFFSTTRNDIANHIKYIDIQQSGIFNSQFALIFKGYEKRRTDNRFNRYLATQADENVDFLEDDEFERVYGPPPWELVNQILDLASLPYMVREPKISERDAPYRFRLIDKFNGIEISANDLSSGEKVLMSLALAIYNTNEGGTKPDLLLLDEPDAPLHPQFSKLFIDTLYEVIYKNAGVHVIITTHSPSTVAMAPDNTIFEIERSTKIPRMVSRAHAIEILTTGLDYLRVTTEDRRQVFVESKNDVQFYQRLYEILREKHTFKYRPIFLEPHNRDPNCEDVVNIVSRLRDSGNELVYGLIDHDNTNNSNEIVFVLGDGERYARENSLLDPMLISLALIREGKKTFHDFGVTGGNAYTYAENLTQDECQTIVDHFLNLCTLNNGDKSTVHLENGYELKYPKLFLSHHGHKYEDLIQEKIVDIKALSRGQGDAKLKNSILRIAAEYPKFISKDISRTLLKLLN